MMSSGNLFERGRNTPPDKPLAARMRPRSLDEVVGQPGLLGDGRLLRRLIQSDRLTSLIFYGPPGTGKTTMGHVIANVSSSILQFLDATETTVRDLRGCIRRATELRNYENRRLILFLDEIHRLQRNQQDVLLPVVEEGLLTLIGATTLNPFFVLNGPLLSRSHLFEFEPLSERDIVVILQHALQDRDRGFGRRGVHVAEEDLRMIGAWAGGDARKALGALEIAVLSTEPDNQGAIHLSRAILSDSIQRRHSAYDRDGDNHYDTASAFIKSMRGSDPDAALYWMARMIEGGEDLRFIARRMLIAASEDVGNADPRALLVAHAALQGAEFVGFPEASIILAQAVCYIATAPKSNAACLAIHRALKDVRRGPWMPVPAHLKDAHYPGAATMGRGVAYKYPHDCEDHWVDQVYLPEDRSYYRPDGLGYEAVILERLQHWKNLRSGKKSGTTS